MIDYTGKAKIKEERNKNPLDYAAYADSVFSVMGRKRPIETPKVEKQKDDTKDELRKLKAERDALRDELNNAPMRKRWDN